jgi:hypothetical protein
MPKKKETLLEKALKTQGKEETLPEELGITNPNLQSAFGDSSEVRVSQPKITKPEPSKYPLETIKIDRSKLTLTQAKKHVLEDIELYNFTIEHIVNDKDFADIKGKQHLCKSGVRKIQLALNISTEIIKDEVWKEDDQWIAKYIVKAIAPSGRFATSVGVCEQFENNRTRTRHDTEATAQTRATSRAILDLVGFGAIGTSEIDDALDNKPAGDIQDAFGG